MVLSFYLPLSRCGRRGAAASGNAWVPPGSQGGVREAANGWRDLAEVERREEAEAARRGGQCLAAACGVLSRCLRAEEDSMHTEERRMPFSGAGGGRREEPWPWSPSSAASWLASSAGVVWRRCSVGEQHRGKGDHGFIDLRRRIDSTARLITSKRLTADSPPPSSASAREWRQSLARARIADDEIPYECRIPVASGAPPDRCPDSAAANFFAQSDKCGAVAGPEPTADSIRGVCFSFLLFFKLVFKRSKS
jgi:hypothetical protein